MAGFAPAPLPHLSLLLDPNYGSAGEAAFLPHIGLVFEPNAYTLTAEVGSYALTGVAATLTYVPLVANAGEPASLPHLGLVLTGLTGSTLPAAAGEFVLTGVAATLKSGRLLTAAAGSYTLTGQDATLDYVNIGSVEFPAPLPHLSLILTGTEGVYSMPALTGTFTVSGQAATLRAGIGLIATTGTFVWTGAPAQRDLQLTADMGQFDVVGWEPTLTTTHLPLTADAGAFTINGYDTGLDYSGGKSLLCSPAAFVLEPNGATGVYARGIQCDTGAFGVFGVAAGYATDGTFETRPGGSGRRHKRKHYVEIDGQYFEVRDQAHAEEIIAALNAAAEEAAVKLAAKRKKPPPVKLIEPTYKSAFTADLQKQLDATNKHIAQMYANALLERQQMENEQEIEELLTLGIL